MKKNRISIIICAIALAAFAIAMPASALASPDDSCIKVVFENDSHCQIDKAPDSGTLTNIGYARLAEFIDDMRSDYANVTVTSSGDSLSGGIAGSFSKGQFMVEAMSSVGYDIVTVGNHDFDFGADYGISLLESLKTESEESTQVVSCNIFKNESPVLDAYAMESYEVDGNPIKVAYVGVITPATAFETNPLNLQDDEGNIVYSFAGDSTGQALYSCIQDAVNDARTNGADYVILLAHLGHADINSQWSSIAVAEHTAGIDAILDAHSHQTAIEHATNKDDEDVLIAQTGSQLMNIGVLTITPGSEEDVSIALVPASDFNPDDPGKESVASVISDIQSRLNEELGEVIGSTSFPMVAKDENGWLVRNAETNLADFAADAIFAEYESLGADCALLNGGGIRENIASGDITKGNLLNVFPFGNYTCLLELSGQQIADALEFGARMYPSNNGGFMQVSNISYVIRTDIESTVQVNEDGSFASVGGQRRVQNIKIGGKPIDLDAKYRVAGLSFLLANHGDGYSMFEGGNPIVKEGKSDLDALIGFLQDDLGGTVGEKYANPAGSGRIIFSDHEIIDPEPDPDPDPTPQPDPNNNSGKSNGNASKSPTALPKASDDAIGIIWAFGGISAAWLVCWLAFPASNRVKKRDREQVR